MVKVKINGKAYNVKEMTFKEYTKMEEQGFSIIEAFRKKQLTLIAKLSHNVFKRRLAETIKIQYGMALYQRR